MYSTSEWRFLDLWHFINVLLIIIIIPISLTDTHNTLCHKICCDGNCHVYYVPLNLSINMANPCDKGCHKCVLHIFYSSSAVYLKMPS